MTLQAAEQTEHASGSNRANALEAYRKTPGTMVTVRRADRMLAALLCQRGVAVRLRTYFPPARHMNNIIDYRFRGLSDEIIVIYNMFF